MRIDLVCRDAQRVETVADERQIAQPLCGLSVRPDALREPGPEEVVVLPPVGGREERERGHQESAAWHSGVAAGDRESLVELPADIAGDDDRRGSGRRPDGEAVSRPRV